MDLQPGLEASVELTVATGDTAVALGSGDVEVLATPRVVALAEQAAVAAVAAALPADRTSVGSYIELHHLAPTKIGASVVATARLVAVDGARLEFEASVREGDTEVARGVHRRAVVSRARFA